MTKRFGGVTAVDDCSLEVKEREIFGIIGPNGSGKSTFLNLVNGVYKPDSGEIFLENDPIHGLPAHKIARKGIGRIFQVSRVFGKLSVLDNVVVPALQLDEEMSMRVDKALESLKYVGLVDLKDEYAENLSGGQKRLLEFARVLSSDPKIILADEPFAGVHPRIMEKLLGYIIDLNARGKTFILVSHDIPAVMRICAELAVFNYGEKIAQGTPKEIQHDDRVIEAYLGV